MYINYEYLILAILATYVEMYMRDNFSTKKKKKN